MLFPIKKRFELSKSFLSEYVGRQPKWGPLGYVTYKRTYARRKEDGTTEEFWETLKRVVEGCFTIQMNHCLNCRLPWDERKAMKSAQKMYELMWNFKFLPPGRGLWMMGTDYIYERGSAALNNCAFVSTEEIADNFSDPFCFLMEMSMLGVGVAFDTKGAGKVLIQEPKVSVTQVHIVEDSKEGWVNAVRTILDSYVGKVKRPLAIDYSEIRPLGTPIKKFGGIAPGPEPLKKCIETIDNVMKEYIGKKIDSRLIVDLFNIIGKCVVSGGVRRTAELALGDYQDEEYLKLKDPDINGQRMMEWGWASNNSVICDEKTDFTNLGIQTAKNGEPGYFWLENARKYGRIKDGVTWADAKAAGTNPCSEQTLESYEICNLVETFPSFHDSLEEYLNTLKYAYLYAKTVTLIPTHLERTNAIMLRNRRIGLSQSGIIENFFKIGKHEHMRWCDEGYKYLCELDKFYSSWLCIPTSIKMTSVKPSGTVSLLPGVTPGIHYAHSKYYYRTIRVDKTSELLNILEKCNYRIEDSLYGDNTKVVYFPVKEKYMERFKEDVSIWEQVENVALMQHYWADNQVSVTITFKKEEASQIPFILDTFRDRLKSISFLPLTDHKYPQAPYQEISEEEYEEYVSKITPIEKYVEENLESFNGNGTKFHDTDDMYCDSDKCYFNARSNQQEN